MTNESTPSMPVGSRYAGQPVDNSSRRSIRIHSPDPSEISVANNHRTAIIDDFYHGERFWRAVVPLDGVDQVYGQAFNFSKPKTRKIGDSQETIFNRYGMPKRTVPILQHVQSRFTFRADCPIELYPPDEGSESHGEPLRIGDMIYSLEAGSPRGVTFNLRDAMSGNFISIHRFFSTQAMVFERLVVENQYVAESPPLPLTGDQKRRLLIASLLRSHHAGMQERYYLYRFCGTNNCTSGPFQILDRVVDYGLLARLGSLLYRLPLNPRFYLRVRGMDSDPRYHKLLRSEFEAYIRDPATQQRKRDYVRRLIAMKKAERGGKNSPGVSS